LLRNFYREQRAVFASNSEKAANLLNVGVGEVEADLDAAELAAMTSVVALVMNSPDAYTVR
jgi:hypothetical protein